MEKTYFQLVRAHRRTCNPESATEDLKLVPSFPKDYLTIVSKMLTENGYDLDGNKVDEE